MRIALVSWEYPPLVVGGLGAHVDGLARALVRAGHDVAVLTRAHPDAADDSVVEGVRVLRAHVDLPWVPDDQFHSRVMSGNHQITRLAAILMARGWVPDVVHAHDWLVAWSGDVLRALWHQPFVATIHATERGRHGGHITNAASAAINAAERWLTYQANRVIACSQFMVEQVETSFELPRGKVDMIPNGVDAEPWTATHPIARSSAAKGAPLVVTWGRLEYEKGFQTLIAAMARLRHGVPGVRLAVLGRGTYAAELQRLAIEVGVADIVRFAGFVSDEELKDALHTAACVVIPSFYEPFGIVALEALAAGAPVVASAAGGLAEVLDGTGAGLLYPPGDVDALADAVRRMLTEPGLADRAQAAGRALVHGRYSWDAVAAATTATYERAGAVS